MVIKIIVTLTSISKATEKGIVIEHCTNNYYYAYYLREGVYTIVVLLFNYDVLTIRWKIVLQSRRLTAK